MHVVVAILKMFIFSLVFLIVKAQQEVDYGPYWTAWSEWTGCRGVDHNLTDDEFRRRFCAHPKRYLARAISYRECRLPDGNPHAVFNTDNITDYSAIKPPHGDPAGNSLAYEYFPTWYSGVARHVSLPSIRPSCDPKLADYAAISDEYETAMDVEQAVLNGVRITGVTENFVFKITRESRCLDSIECPVPLSWSSWNCHCPSSSSGSSDENNIHNLALCGCSAEVIQRKRVRLCTNDNNLGCGELGRVMEELYPNGCKSDGERNNWYNQAEWIDGPDDDASFIGDLRDQFIFQDHHHNVNNGSFEAPDYIDQCWEPHRNTIFGQKVPISHTYEPGEGYGIQYQDCRRILAEWSTWGDWSTCPVSCGGGSITRRRQCQRADGSDTQGTDCMCVGDSTQTRSCGNQCCPVWHIKDENDQWVPQSNKLASFSPCPKCGDGDQSSTRRCQCTGANGIVLHGNLSQGQCTLDVGEMIVNIHTGITTKPCLNLPCCAGWTEWSGWEACETTCFDHLKYGNVSPQNTTIRTRACGCKNGVDLSTVDRSLCSNSTYVEEKLCPSRHPCPFWSEWGEPSACSVSCAPMTVNNGTQSCSTSGGTQTRERECINGEVGDCVGGEEIEITSCDDIPSCCSYQSWSEWGPCHAESRDGDLHYCNTDESENTGMMSRTRLVACGGDDCVEKDAKITCTLPPCPAWAEWANWSGCSGGDASTNGTRARSRVCDGAEIGSVWCPIEQIPLQHHAQLLGYLEVDTCQSFGLQWTQWTECSVTCGVGTQRREKPCSNGELGLTPECSLEEAFEQRPCASVACDCAIKVISDLSCGTPCTKSNFSLVDSKTQTNSSTGVYLQVLLIIIAILM